jgi:hypothetical protein
VAVTIIVEPNPGGHRFQYVRHVASLAAKSTDVVLLTSRGAAASAEYGTFLRGLPLEVHEAFDEPLPATAAIAATVADVCRGEVAPTVVVMDGDQLIKRWWLEAPRAFRGLPSRPQVILLLTRLPARLTFADRTGWLHKLAKTALSLLALVTRSAHRVLYIAGRDDLATGFLLRRVRDPAICSAHARDREGLRRRLELPSDRHLVGILGGINGRKNYPLVAAAVRRAATDVDLLLAGSPTPDVQAWLDNLPAGQRERVIVRFGFLSDDDLDGYVATCDVVAIAHENNAPSGIMGKAVAAGVPVLTAGSTVRAHECAALGSGVHTAMTEDGLAAGIRQLLGGNVARARRRGRMSLPTAEEFAEVILTGIPTKRAASA